MNLYVNLWKRCFCV